MGLFLFTSINTFAMNTDDNNQNSPAEYLLACGICGKQMETAYTNVKTVFHSKCLITLAQSKYVTDNPIITSQPWLEQPTPTTPSVPQSRREHLEKYGLKRQ